MTAGERWTLGRRPALDGLRGIAIILVLLEHARVPVLTWSGQAGVTMFFTLSGFLITSLLLEESARTGMTNLRLFWLRRARRLLPALLVFVAAVGGVGMLIPWFAPPLKVVAALTYWINWIDALQGATGGLSHLWSLAIEEQFYLTWPIVVILCARWGRHGLYAVTGLGAVASLVTRLALWDEGDGTARIVFGTDTRADGLLIGCALGVALHHSREVGPRSWTAVVGFGSVAVAVVTPTPAAHVFGPTFVALATAAIIYACVTSTSVRALEHPALVLLGRRSYAVYLWNCPIAILVTLLYPGRWVLALAIVAPASWVLALLSWRYVEEPFLRGREATGSQRVRSEGVLRLRT